MGPSTRRLPWARVDPRVVDAVVAAALLVVFLLSFGVEVRAGQRAPDLAAALLGAGLSLPFAVHRRWPLPSMGVALVALLGYSLLQYAPYPGVSVFVLLFGVTLHATRRASLLALGGAVVALLVSLAAQPPGVVVASDWVSTLLATAVAWLAADNLRQRRARWHALEERARSAEREREEHERAAITAERLRIARELHDVVAHSMSVIAVQAGVGHHVIDTDLEAARSALASVESTSRAGLVEMRRLLGVLRDGTEAVRTPSPGLGDLPQLIARTRGSGLGVTLAGNGSRGDLPPAAGLTAYRIIQEALTNVIKHGGPAALVRVDCTDSAVTIEVIDDGRPGPASSDSLGAGQGLMGMRERVGVFGGEFAAGRRPGGGFRVFATLPYAGGTP